MSENFIPAMILFTLIVLMYQVFTFIWDEVVSWFDNYPRPVAYTATGVLIIIISYFFILFLFNI